MRTNKILLPIGFLALGIVAGILFHWKFYACNSCCNVEEILSTSTLKLIQKEPLQLDVYKMTLTDSSGSVSTSDSFASPLFIAEYLSDSVTTIEDTIFFHFSSESFTVLFEDEEFLLKQGKKCDNINRVLSGSFSSLPSIGGVEETLGPLDQYEIINESPDIIRIIDKTGANPDRVYDSSDKSVLIYTHEGNLKVVVASCQPCL